jgi:hypothetical protein
VYYTSGLLAINCFSDSRSRTKRLGWRMPSLSYPDTAGLSVLKSILNQRLSSRSSVLVQIDRIVNALEFKSRILPPDAPTDALTSFTICTATSERANSVALPPLNSTADAIHTQNLWKEHRQNLKRTEKMLQCMCHLQTRVAQSSRRCVRSARQLAEHLQHAPAGTCV